MKLKNISYRKYEPKDFDKLFELFLKFQSKVKLTQYDNLGKNQSIQFFLPYLVGELKKLLKDHKYHFVLKNNENNEIIGYACLDDSIIMDGQIDLILLFKDENITYAKIFKYILFLGLKKEFEGKRIFAVLTQRDRFNTYFEFIKRVIPVYVMRKDSFGKVYLEILI